ncbi:MAG: hypothetical protein LBC92_00995 [Rickettsiales bacterium]|jgi:hypothetical protein|nr:hypothetical protein [Rickettsiales bacterium]
MINIVCIKWGNKVYTEKDVNRLYASIKKNTTLPFNFYCFTDEPSGFLPEIKTEPLPDIRLNGAVDIYTKEVGLCDNNLADLNGKRVFFFDLDIAIISNLDALFNYPKNDEFYIIENWNKKNRNIGQATCYSFIVGKLGYIRDYYKQNESEVFKKYGKTAQEYLSAKVIEKYGKLNFFPPEWFISFKIHCLPKWYLRYFLTPNIPNDKTIKILCFHGHPRPNEAVKGEWSEKKAWKKLLYKHIKPCKWLELYGY